MLMIEEGRKGPFRDQGGRSHVIHSTANTQYRRRGTSMEITIKRGASLTEINILLAKLNAHKMLNGSSSYVTVIVKGKRFRLGVLNSVNMDVLKKQIINGVDKGVIGLLITDVQNGPLTSFQVHGYNFANDVMGDKSIFAV